MHILAFSVKNLLHVVGGSATTPLSLSLSLSLSLYSGCVLDGGILWCSSCGCCVFVCGAWSPAVYP